MIKIPKKVKIETIINSNPGEENPIKFIALGVFSNISTYINNNNGTENILLEKRETEALQKPIFS